MADTSTIAGIIDRWRSGGMTRDDFVKALATYPYKVPERDRAERIKGSDAERMAQIDDFDWNEPDTFDEVRSANIRGIIPDDVYEAIYDQRSARRGNVQALAERLRRG
jgi:hypothetical protein